MLYTVFLGLISDSRYANTEGYPVDNVDCCGRFVETVGASISADALNDLRKIEIQHKIENCNTDAFSFPKKTQLLDIGSDRFPISDYHLYSPKHKVAARDGLDCYKNRITNLNALTTTSSVAKIFTGKSNPRSILSRNKRASNNYKLDFLSIPISSSSKESIEYRP